MGHWADSISRIAEIDTRRMAMEDMITADKYGQWTITELLDGSVSDDIQRLAFDVIDAYDRAAKRQLNTWHGASITVTLDVMSRQACSMDADRKELHPREMHQEEKPVDGDIVIHYGDVKMPLGKQITSREIRIIRARGESERKTFEYTVKNGKIKVPFFHARDMLFSHGFRLPTVSSRHVTFPPSRQEIEESAYTKKTPRTREVTNWWFREVFDNEGDAAPEPEKKDYRRK